MPPHHASCRVFLSRTGANAYLDGFVRCSAQPVVARREAKAIDGAARVQGVQMLALADVPQHGNSVLATGGAQRAIRRNRHCVQNRCVAYKIGHELASRQTPDLKPPDNIPNQMHLNSTLLEGT